QDDERSGLRNDGFAGERVDRSLQRSNDLFLFGILPEQISRAAGQAPGDALCAEPGGRQRVQASSLLLNGSRRRFEYADLRGRTWRACRRHLEILRRSANPSGGSIPALSQRLFQPDIRRVGRATRGAGRVGTFTFLAAFA